jgi:hypothetical protein
MKKDLFQCLRVLPTDYDTYGGDVHRWSDPELGYPDCSVGCKHFVPLVAPYTSDWGICSKRGAPRAGLLTFEHQAGQGCFEWEDTAAGRST